MAEQVQLKEHQLQPLANMMKQVDCHIVELKAAIQALASVGGSQQLTITVLPPRTSKLNWGHVVVGTSPSLIRAADSKRISLLVINGGAATVFVGTDSTVTTDAGNNPGAELLAQSAFGEPNYTGDVYGVVAAGTLTLTYWEPVME